MLTARNGLIAAILAGLMAAAGLSFQGDGQPDAGAERKHGDDAVVVALNNIAAAIRESKCDCAECGRLMEQLRPQAANRGYTGCIVEVSDVAATLAARSACPPCNDFVSDANRSAVPNGWRFGTSGTDHFKFVQTAGPWPVFRFFRDGTEFRRIEGYRGLDEIWKHHPAAVRN